MGYTKQEIRDLYKEVRADEQRELERTRGRQKPGPVLLRYPQIGLSIGTTLSYFIYRVRTRPFNAYTGFWLDVRVKTQTLLIVSGLFFHVTVTYLQVLNAKKERERQELLKRNKESQL